MNVDLNPYQVHGINLFFVEVIFMIPWAANYGVMSKEFGFFVLAEMIVFVGILMIGWIYAVKKGAFSKIY